MEIFSVEKLSVEHKAGFVAIVGQPNVGKSTLMNALIGEKLSIVTSKAQTTRHRIMGILNDAHYQIVYSDTPGILKPKYELHKAMMRFVSASLEDADVILYVVEAGQLPTDIETIERLKKATAPVLLILNKTDLLDPLALSACIEQWKALNLAKHILPIAALKNFGVETVIPAVLQELHVHPPFFDKEDLSDRTERFFAAEMIRERIFELYQEEIPYSSEVAITSFKEKDDMLVISAEIYVERSTQKGIIIGKAGAGIKKLGIKSRESMEQFFQKKVFLETQVKVVDHWRNNELTLKRFGYHQES